jgi:hypothetical protein
MVFLVQCSQGGSPGTNFNVPTGRDEDLERTFGHIGDTVRGILDKPWIVPLIVSLVVVGVALWVVFLWLGSRAHFVFLDQVAGRHWRIDEPWGRTRVQGNSLFLWRLAFTAVVLVAALLILVPLVLGIVVMARRSEGLALALGLGVGVPVGLAFVIPIAYTQCFLSHFVIPIMYREGLRSTAAWRRFLPLMRAHFGAFVVFGLFMFLITVGVVIALFLFGCVTCCVGLVIMILPYIGTVFTLPIHYTWRGFGPNFLAQFGAAWWSWPQPAVAAGPPIPLPEPPEPPSGEPAV